MNTPCLSPTRLGLCAVVAVVVLGWTSAASAFYPWRIPNGYTNRSAATGGRCWICHVSAAGGGTRTVFGEAFRNNGHTWNRELAELDSDGDGYSNGQELGDPWALWVAGSAANNPPPPAVPVYNGLYYSNPGTSQQPSESSYNTCSSSSRNDCDTNASCTRNPFNGIGDWFCTCDVGWDPNGRQGHNRTNSHDFTQGVINNDLYNILNFFAGCVDHNECSPNPCGPGTCTQGSPPTYTCSCNPGYMPSGGTCVNENECVTMPGVCGVGSCSDMIGSYSCICPGGFVFNGSTCVVDNACDAGTDDCDIPAEATCTPVGMSSWNCTCNLGYTGFGTPFRGTGDDCRDNDECRPTDPCGVGTCTNTPGSYTCNCPSGYSSSRGTCVDDNECRPDPCGLGGAGCTNLPGTFMCACLPGYSFDGLTCADVDECAAAPCGMGTCVETEPPGYSCSCDAGYTVIDGTCVDLDECTPALLICSSDATCINSPGSFTCDCNTGFEGNGVSCIDIDECATGTHTCDIEATCANTTGAFTCTCRDGYEGSGAVCTDVNECADGTDGCGVNEVCLNREGLTNDCVCRAGFGRDEDGACVTQCGNGERTPGEECDDGDIDSEDGCDANCLIEPGWACFEPTGGASECTYTCGDEFINPPAEECDDNTANSDTEPDACRTNCRLAHCGDSVIDTGETCDDGESNSDETADACRSTCIPAFCGDGVVDSTESCDPGGGSALPGAECGAACSTVGGDAGPDGGGGDPMDGGCGCRAVTGPRPSSVWLLLPLVGLLLRRRRR